MKQKKLNQGVSDVLGNVLMAIFGGKKAVKDAMKDPQLRKAAKQLKQKMQEVNKLKNLYDKLDVDDV